MNEIPLCQLRPGEWGTMRALDLGGSLRRRLGDMGLIPGTKIQCAYIGPHGSPIAFWIRGAMVALRRTDCGKIVVERGT